MFSFKDYLLAESYEKVYKSITRDLIIEQVCLNSLKIISEFWQNIGPDGRANYDFDDFDGDLDALKFPDPDDNVRPIEEKEPDEEEEKPDTQISGRQSGSDDLRTSTKKLHNAILILRWNAMANRNEEIKQLQAFRDKYIEDYGNPFPAKVTESTEDDDDDDDDASSRFSQLMRKSKFDVMKTVPLLEKLGYIKLNDLYDEGLDDNEVKKAITAALFKAADEQSNDPPPGVDITPQRVNEAKKDFFESIRKIFRNQFRKIVKSQSSLVSTKKGMVTVGRLFDPGERGVDDIIGDIANIFSLELYDTFTKREVSKGNAQPWLSLKEKTADGKKKDIGFGSKGIEEIDDEKNVDILINYIRTTLKHFYSNQQRKQKASNAPSGATMDLEAWGGNRDKKASMINFDIDNENLEFYKRHIASDSSEIDNELGILNKKLKETKKLSKEEHEKKWRLEIISQIIFEHSKHSESLSLDPDKIVDTLRFYRSNYLGKKYRTQSFFGAMVKKTDDGEGDIDATANLGDSGSNRDRGQSSFPNPASFATDGEMKKTLHEKLLAALNALRRERSGKEHALAICVFWELGNCSLNSSFTNIDNFSSLMVNVGRTEEQELKKIRKKRALGQQLTPEEAKKEIKYSSCEHILFNNLRSAGGMKGKSIEQASQEINAILGYDVPENTFRNWLNNGVKYICNYMKGQRSSLSSFAPTTAPTMQSRKYDPTRASPLSRLKVPKVETDPATGEKKYETN